MHKEILSKEQVELLPFLELFAKRFYLVGGTAIALHIGHRKSIDFDFFTLKSFSNASIRKEFNKQSQFKFSFIGESEDQIHYNINHVKVTFFEYPYSVEAPHKFDNTFKLPSLLSLAAMKAFALGRRAKWKDYVDLYFIIRDFYSVEEIIKQTLEIFGSNNFNAKLFREQLSYFNDIDYSEKVEFLSGFEVPDEEVKNFLIQQAIQKF